MKKVKYLIIILMMLCFLPLDVFAVGNISVSTTNLNIVKGKTASFKITANNSVGRVDISTSNSGVASISTSSLFLDMQSDTVKVTGKTVGTATIKVYAYDVTSYDDEDLTGTTYIINVNVVEATSNNVNNLSNNNNIKDLSIEGFNITKVDNNNYTLTVNNNVTNIYINATAEDAKAKISGIGKHKLNVGINNIQVAVTSESGITNKINIKVTRKDGYYLEDLDLVLNDSLNEDININLNLDSVISVTDLNKIKESKKRINFNYYDENKNLIYSWSINGAKIENINEFLTSISYISEYSKEISKLSNYADGIYVSLKQNGTLLNDTKLKLFVGDKFDNGSNVNLYYYDTSENELDNIIKSLLVKDGYIEFDVKKGSEYFITMSNISNTNVNNNMLIDNLFKIIAIIEFLIIIIFIVIYCFKRRNSGQIDINSNFN